MTELYVLWLGVGLGLRHATDADHVVVVSALVQREPGVWRAARVAALWGAGHTAAFLGLGLLVVLTGVRIPSAFENLAELLVASMLIGFGVWHFGRSRMPAKIAAETPRHKGPSVRPVLIGLVHGLAGSAGIALLTATTIAPRVLAAAHLVLFGLGTVLGMVALTVVMSKPIGWTVRREGPLKNAVTLVAALLSMALGVAILVRAFLGQGTS